MSSNGYKEAFYGISAPKNTMNVELVFRSSQKSSMLTITLEESTPQLRLVYGEPEETPTLYVTIGQLTHIMLNKAAE